MCLARIARKNGKRPVLTAFEFRSWAEGESQEKVLGRLASDYGLKRAPCTTILALSEYSLLLTEAPEVPPDELRAAIRWRVKDLIDFHINDAALDVFDVPGERVVGRARPLYAVAARSAAIQKRVDLLDAANINLQVIDIPELAQRNLAELLPEDAVGVALLSFSANGGLLTITKQGELYLSRNLDVGLEALSHGGEAAAYFDRIVLEVQRSLDYYDSHFRQPPVAGLVLAPTPDPIAGLDDHLRANLNVGVSVMNLGQLIEQREQLGPLPQSRCLLAIGAALRREVKTL